MMHSVIALAAGSTECSSRACTSDQRRPAHCHSLGSQSDSTVDASHLADSTFNVPESEMHRHNCPLAIRFLATPMAGKRVYVDHGLHQWCGWRKGNGSHVELYACYYSN
jgi:hypothetical protein